MRTKVLLPLGLALALIVLAVPAPSAARQDEPLLLVACAPGYPGSPAQAQPTMDRFAALVATAAGLPEGGLTAEFRDEEDDGVERIRTAGDLVIVPLPFFLKYEEELALDPIVGAVPLSGADHERWSLVAPAGRVTGPEDLAGWELVGVPAYAPAFVRGTLLGGWGRLPDSTTLTFTDRVLRGLRRVAAGENVAVLLDGAQTAALPELPMADAIEIVTTSEPLVPALVAAVGDALGADLRVRLRDGLLRVHEAERFHELLTTLQLSRFAPLDGEELARVRASYRAGR